MRVPDDVTLLWADDKCVLSKLELFSWSHLQTVGEMSEDTQQLKRETGLEVLGFTIMSVILLLDTSMILGAHRFVRQFDLVSLQNSLL